MKETAGGGRARATVAARTGRVVAASGWTPGAAEEHYEMQTPIGLSPAEERAGDPPIDRGRRLLLLLAWPLDRTGLTGWRLVGAMGVVVGGLWLATELLWVYPR